ncbi:MAG: head-tail connector protein [Holosporales bacterium]|jgi:uncharacterized phiE125 gp8 family phage protein|nr:head-tail connector protein [Holosporales bacterium]
MSLKLLQKPESEPVGLDEIKIFLRLEHELDDNLLNILITTARELVEKFLGRSLITQKWQYKTRMEVCGNSIQTWNVVENCPFAMNINIILPNAPIVEVTDLICNGTKIEESGFKLVHIDDREILSLQVKQSIATQTLDILTEYVAGYGEQAEDVPSTVRLAIMLLVGRIYKDRNLISNDQEILLDSVKHLLCSYRISSEI